MQRQTPQVVRALIISDDGGEENESNWGGVATATATVAANEAALLNGPRNSVGCSVHEEVLDSPAVRRVGRWC